MTKSGHTACRVRPRNDTICSIVFGTSFVSVCIDYRNEVTDRIVLVSGAVSQGADCFRPSRQSVIGVRCRIAIGIGFGEEVPQPVIGSDYCIAQWISDSSKASQFIIAEGRPITNCIRVRYFVAHWIVAVLGAVAQRIDYPR